MTHPSGPPAARPRRAEKRFPLLAGVATVAVGIVNVVSALLPAAGGRVHVLLSVA
jgi:hypothetical protein